MSRLGRLWKKIEGSDRADRNSSNQQFTHDTLLWLAPGVPLLSSLVQFYRTSAQSSPVPLANGLF
jgi:hypothetical protein